MAITVSERDFEAFCESQSWSTEKLAEREDVRTPDYRVTTQTGYSFIVEVTEFEQEPPRPPGEIRCRSETYGKRLRRKLEGKAKQVRAIDTDEPTLILVCGEFERLSDLEPMAFDYALYGTYTISVDVESGSIESEFQGAGQFFNPKHNTRVSAAASLFGRPHELSIFHNQYAAVPLEPSRLIVGTDRVVHYLKDEDPGWTTWKGS